MVLVQFFPHETHLFSARDIEQWQGLALFPPKACCIATSCSSSKSKHPLQRPAQWIHRNISGNKGLLDSHMQYRSVSMCFLECVLQKTIPGHTRPQKSKWNCATAWSETTSSSTTFAKKGSMHFFVCSICLIKMVQVLNQNFSCTIYIYIVNGPCAVTVSKRFPC